MAVTSPALQRPHRSTINLFETMRLPLVIAAAAAVAVFPNAQAGTDDHRYKKGEHVELWVNKVS